MSNDSFLPCISHLAGNLILVLYQTCNSDGKITTCSASATADDVFVWLDGWFPFSCKEEEHFSFLSLKYMTIIQQ